MYTNRYAQAKRAVADREAGMRAVVEELECGLTLIGLTGVEDKLQVRR